jgi:hypothetical protein
MIVRGMTGLSRLHSLDFPSVVVVVGGTHCERGTGEELVNCRVPIAELLIWAERFPDRKMGEGFYTDGADGHG